MVTFENICQGLDRFLCPDTSMSHLLKVVTFSLVICVTDMSVFTSNECLTTIFRQITPFYYFIPNLTTSSHQLTYEFYSKPYNFHCSKKAKFDIVLLFPNMICTESNHQRISFSSDLGQSDNASPPPALIRRDESLLDSSNSSFEFHISNNFDPGDSSPADEIFADGMILPFHVTPPSTAPKRLYKYELPPITSSLSPSPLPPQPLPPKHIEKDTSGANSDSEAEKSSKSFWSFKRSSSLNCDLKKSLICSFPRLTRSNSTGSVTNSKRAMLRDVNNHRVSPTSSSSSSSVCCNYHFRPQKHTGKKGEAGGGSFSAIPVLSGPSTFGLGSFLRHSKKKKNKK
ncbi:BnaC06g02230D [Brassica napus]|uniref:BnaC06g02230D protein n=2 Tax=Brassica napus TaxID=3708 RepID=A0A078HS19_BRANA|nr:BnaC06g02230D [Brassica napus]